MSQEQRGAAQSPSEMKRGSSEKSPTTTATLIPYYRDPYYEIVEPTKFDKYLIGKWAKDLGPLGLMIVKMLRHQGFYSQHSGALRNEIELDMEELAESLGVHRATLFREFANNEALGQFVERQKQYQVKGGKYMRAKNAYRIAMQDPIHPSDMDRYELLCIEREQQRQQEDAQRLDAARGGRNYRLKDDSYESQIAIQREKQGIGHESQNATYRTGNGRSESQNATADTEYLSSQNASADTTYPLEQNAPAIGLDLPPVLFTKDSLTPPARRADASESPRINAAPRGKREKSSVSSECTRETTNPNDPNTLLWEQCLSMLVEQVNKPTFETHLRALRLVRIEPPVDDGSETFMLECPSSFTLEWLEKRHRPAIEEAACRARGNNVVIHLMLKGK
jgi:hypothetical protein